MTTDRWTDDMLDRLVGAVNTLASISERNNHDIQALLNIAQIHQQNVELGDFLKIRYRLLGSNEDIPFG